MSLGDICAKVCTLAQRAGLDVATRGYALSAVLKLTTQLGGPTPAVSTLVDKFANSRHVDLAQRCIEFRHLTSRPGLMRAVLPVDASTEDIEVDVNMPFLNGFVAEALSAGARPYAPPARDDGDADASHKEVGLKYEAYEKPSTNPVGALFDAIPTGAGGGAPGPGGFPSLPTTDT